MWQPSLNALAGAFLSGLPRSAFPNSSPIRISHQRVAAKVEAIKADNKERQKRKPAEEFICECGESFERECWHCANCNHHWPLEREECHNCYAKRPNSVSQTFDEQKPNDRRTDHHRAKMAGKLLAERRLGEALAAMDLNAGTKVNGTRRLHDTTTAKLSDLGITKDQSHRWTGFSFLRKSAQE